MDPHTAETVLRYANRLDNAKHGQKEPIIAEALQELGCSRATFYTLLDDVRPSNRKRRADAGVIALTKQEADDIAIYLQEGVNSTGKRGRTIKKAVETLRANGKILAARVDEETGEVFRLSMTAISRALRYYQQHPDQLALPTPHSNMSYPHPNHTHQVDSSTGTIYYLKDGSAVFELDAGEHYKNKPWNIEAVSEWRVIRYVLTDMCTGVVRFLYYPKSENARHTVDFLAWVWAPKDDPSDPFHGVPMFLYCDGGIANALVRRFCERLGVKLIVHKAKNSRATGGVESAHNHAVELPFEHGLRDVKHRINGFEDLNAMARQWQLWWNANEAHGRHKMKRFEAWMHIKESELRVTCDYKTLLTLATERPKRCQVQGNLTAMFKARIWDVSHIPGIQVKGDVFLHWHPFIADCAMAVVEGEDGRETHIQLEEVTGTVDPSAGQWGFLANAAEFGKEYKPKPDTAIDKNRKRLKLIASGSETQKDDERKRKSKDFVAFGKGTVNPYIEAETAELPTYLNKRGTDLKLTAPMVELTPLTHIQAAKALRHRLAGLGIEWTAEHLQTIQKRYPTGVPETDLDGLFDEFTQPIRAPVKLAIVK